MKKRSLILILFILLCFTLMPVCAFAASEIIDEVNVFVTAPAGGKTVTSCAPTCVAKSGDNTLDNVVFISADWEENSGDNVWKPLSGTDTFKATNTYRLNSPMLYLAEGYTFDANVKVKMNGNDLIPVASEDVVYLSSQTFVASCTVTFEMNGHGTAPTALYDEDGLLLEPEAPTDDVYAFAGWFLDSGLKQKMTFPTKLTSDVTIYAAWKPRVNAVDIYVTQAKREKNSLWLEGSYKVDGSTDNTDFEYAQYTSTDGVTWTEVFYTSGIAYNTQNKIDFTVFLTDSGARMIDDETVVTVHGAEGAKCEIKKGADKVNVTVIYVLPPKKFTVKFNTDGYTPAIPDQEVDALSTIDFPDMSAYTEGEWRFIGWNYGENNAKRWQETDIVWDDTVLTARFEHYAKVTLIMSSTGEKIAYWDKYNTWLKSTVAFETLYSRDDYYVLDFYLDQKMTDRYNIGVTLTGDLTLYVDAKLKISEVDFNFAFPSDGKKPNYAVNITYTNPENKVALASCGPWYVSENAKLGSWHKMEGSETFTAGRYYEIEIEFGLTDDEHYTFPYGGNMIVKLNGEDCHWFFGGKGLTVKIQCAITGMVEFEMNGHGKFIRSQDIYPAQKAARPEDPTEAGYKFTGWYTDKECKTLYDFDSLVNGNLLLYAGWEKRVDHVDADFTLPWLHCKAGSSVTTLTANHKEAVLSASRILWKKNDGSGWVLMKADEEFVPGMDYRAEFTVTCGSEIPFAENVKATVHGSNTGVTYSLDASGNLKIVYTKHLEYTKHKVIFDTEGKASPIEEQIVEEGLTIKSPSDPTEKDYVFDGWYTDPQHKKRFDFSSPIVEDMTLYAHWMRPIHSVTITIPALFDGKTPPEKIYLKTEYGDIGLWFTEEKAEWEKDNTHPLDYWHIFGRLQEGHDYTIRHVAIPIAGNDWFFADDLEIVSSTGSVEVLSVNKSYAEVNIHVKVNNGGIENPPTPGGHQTDDNSNISLWTSLLLLSVITLGAAMVYSKKKNNM